MPPGLSRQNLSNFLCISTPKRDLDTKETKPNIEVCPVSLERVITHFKNDYNLNPQKIDNQKMMKINSGTLDVLIVFSLYFNLFTLRH